MNTPIHDQLVMETKATPNVDRALLDEQVSVYARGGVVYVDNLSGLWRELKPYGLAVVRAERQSRHGRIKHLRDERRRMMKRMVKK